MSNNVKITTNNVPREIIDASQLTQKEQALFDYLDWPAIEQGSDSASFFRYRGTLYDLGEFTAFNTTESSPVSEPFKGWHGYQSDSFFSGLLVKYTEDGESVIVASYYSL